MDLLSAPFDPEREAPAVSPARPALGVALVSALLLAVARALELSDVAAAPMGRALAGATVHAGFVALGWVIALEGRSGWLRPALVVAGASLGAFGLSRLTPWGSLAHLLVPAVLVCVGRQDPRLRRIGLLAPAGLAGPAAGFGAGAFLGLHLLISASRTFGYVVRVASVGSYATSLAYDVGANALSAEWLFRGALFSRWWRRWGFWAAAAASTAAALVRYLLDPALPRTIEVGTGAIFYLALLGLTGCALRAWSGSLLPGYLAAVAFFAAYRALAV